MRRFIINVEARSPLAVRSDHAPTGSANSKYITGTTLLGSLATAYRLYNPNEKERFEQLFLREDVQFSHLYPAVFNKDSLKTNSLLKPFSDKEDYAANLVKQRLPVYPVPKTAQTCKRYSGFRRDEDDPKDEREGHGVRDSLIDWGWFALARKQQNGASYTRELGERMLAPLRAHKNCHCGESTDRFDGYYRWKVTKPEAIEAPADKYTRLQTHTGINRTTGTVEEGILYNRQVFEEGMQFWGEIIFPDDDDLIKHFWDFIKEVGQAGLIRIGTGRTRGMGNVALQVDETEEQANDEKKRAKDFKDRLEQFDKVLHGKAGTGEELANSFFFPITLHSPAILTDELLRYRGTINKETLNELLGFQIEGLDLLYEAASTKRITGWQELWGTPRIDEYAIDTGSVFLFQCAKSAEGELKERLFDLEEQGIGKRRAEGFGRIRVADPFHLRVGELHE